MTEREFVSRLIVLVLTGKLSVREAILRFPKDTTDKHILSAYYALIHYEADEDMRSRDIEFKEEQDDYLYMISELFANNKDLPLNIVKSYEDYFPEVELPKSKNVVQFIKRVCNFLNIK